jgi:hypothetical protein
MNKDGVLDTREEAIKDDADAAKFAAEERDRAAKLTAFLAKMKKSKTSLQIDADTLEALLTIVTESGATAASMFILRETWRRSDAEQAKKWEEKGYPNYAGEETADTWSAYLKVLSWLDAHKVSYPRFNAHGVLPWWWPRPRKNAAALPEAYGKKKRAAKAA